MTSKLFTSLLVAAAASACSDYRAPTLGEPFGNGTNRLAPLPDTIYGRAFVATVDDGDVRGGRVDFVIDQGTTQEQRLPFETCAGPRYNSYYWCGFVPWSIYPPVTLENGLHAIRLISTDQRGRETSSEVRFVTRVDDVLYQVASLDAPGATDLDALDINASGAVAGWATIASVRHAARWSATGALTLLDTSSSQANAINDAGLTVGRANGQPVSWLGSDRQAFPTTGTAVDVNNSGLVAINSADLVNLGASLWQNGATTVATTFACSCSIFKLNDQGQVVGLQRLVESQDSWDNGLRIRAPTPPGAISPHIFSGTIALNNRGDAAGQSSSAASISEIYLSQNDQPSRTLFTEFGIPAANNQVSVVALNDSGDLLVFESTSHTAFLLRNGRVLRVRLSGGNFRLDSVHGINAAGEIVGHATDPLTNASMAVVLKPAA